MPASSAERLFFVTPYRALGQRYPDLVPVSLPRDIGRFMLDDDPDGGFDVLFKHRGKWCPLDGSVWEAEWGEGQAPTCASRMNVVYFGRMVLHRMHVRESARCGRTRGKPE